MDEKNEKKIGDPSIEVGGEILSMKMICKSHYQLLKYIGITQNLLINLWNLKNQVKVDVMKKVSDEDIVLI